MWHKYVFAERKGTNRLRWRIGESVRNPDAEVDGTPELRQLGWIPWDHTIHELSKFFYRKRLVLGLELSTWSRMIFIGSRSPSFIVEGYQFFPTHRGTLQGPRVFDDSPARPCVRMDVRPRTPNCTNPSFPPTSGATIGPPPLGSPTIGAHCLWNVGWSPEFSNEERWIDKQPHQHSPTLPLLMTHGENGFSAVDGSSDQTNISQH